MVTNDVLPIKFADAARPSEGKFEFRGNGIAAFKLSGSRNRIYVKRTIPRIKLEEEPVLKEVLHRIKRFVSQR